MKYIFIFIFVYLNVFCSEIKPSNDEIEIEIGKSVQHFFAQDTYMLVTFTGNENITQGSYVTFFAIGESQNFNCEMKYNNTTIDLFSLLNGFTGQSKEIEGVVYKMNITNIKQGTTITIGSRRINSKNFNQNPLSSDGDAIYGLIIPSIRSSSIECFNITKIYSFDIFALSHSENNFIFYLSNSTTKRENETYEIGKKGISFTFDDIYYTNLCVASVQVNSSEVFYSFQILSRKTNTSSTEPIINAITYNYIQHSGQTKVYKYFYHLKGNIDTIYIRNVKSKIDFSFSSCNEASVYGCDVKEPGEYNSLNEYNAPEILTPINGVYIKNFVDQGPPLTDKAQMVLIVKCLSEEDELCSFDISIYNNNHPLKIDESSVIFNYVGQESTLNKNKLSATKTDIFDYELNNKDNNTISVLFSFLTLRGDCKFKVTTDGLTPNQRNFLNKVEIEYKKTTQKDIFNKYTITINSDTSCLYILYSSTEIEKTISKLTIINKFPITEKIEPEEQKLIPLSNFSDVNTTYTLVITEYENCLLRLNCGNKKINPYGLNFYKYSFSGSDSENCVLTSEKSTDTCYFNLGFSEKEFYIYENLPFKYLLPYSDNKTTLNYITNVLEDLYFTLTTTGYKNLIFRAELNKKQIIDDTQFENSIYLISKNSFQSVINEDSSDILEYKFTVEVKSRTYSDRDIVFVQMLLKKKESKRVMPLEKNVLTKDFLTASEQYVYQLNVINKEEGDIYLMNNNRNYISLNASYNNVYFEYKPFTKSIHYNIENCTSICQMKIGVNSQANNLMASKIYYNPFSFYITSNFPSQTRNPVKVPINTLVSGVIRKEGNFEYYSFFLPYEINSFFITLNCFDCQMYIKEVEGDVLDIPSKDNYQWKIEGDDFNKYLFINNTDTKEAWYNKTFVASVYSDNLSEIDLSKFSFLINGGNEMFKYMVANSDEVNTLSFKSESIPIMVPINPSNGNYTLSFYASSDIESELEINAKIVPYDSVIALGKDGLENFEPSLNDFNYTSRNNFYKNLLEIDIKENSNYSYVILKIFNKNSIKEETISFYISDYESDKMSFNGNFEIYLSSNKSSPKNLTYSNDDNYAIYVKQTEGRGTVYFDQTNKYNLENYGDTLIFKRKKGPNILNYHSMDLDQKFKFVSSFTKDFSDLNFNRISYNSKGTIYYKKSQFPLLIFTAIPDDDYDSGIIFNSEFMNLLSKANSTLDNNFSIKGHLVLKEEIYKKMKNKSYEIESIDSFDGLFNYGLLKGQLAFNSIQSYNITSDLYALIIIDNEKEDREFDNLDLRYNIMKANNQYYISPAKEYFFGNLEEGTNITNFYTLRKLSSEDKKIKLEFAANSIFINFAYLTSREGYLYRNSTDLVLSEYQNKNGKRQLIFTMEYNEEIYISVFSTNATHKVEDKSLTNYIIRYDSADNFSFNKRPKSDTLTLESLTENSGIVTGAKIKFKGIFNNLTNGPIKTKFIGKIFDNDDPHKYESFTTISFNALNPHATIILDYTDEEDLEINFENIKINKNNLVIAVEAVTKDGEIFSYNSIDFTKMEDDEIKGVSLALALIILIGFILMLIAIILLKFYLMNEIKREQKRNESKSMENIIINEEAENIIEEIQKKP